MDLNVWIGEGNIAADPKIFYVGEKETPKLSFRMGNHRGYNGRDKVNWINCIVWGTRAENLMKLLKKGDKVSIVGELELRSWKDDEGWHNITEIKALEVNIIPSNGVQTNKSSGKSPSGKPKVKEGDPFDVEEDKNKEEEWDSSLEDLVDW